MRPTVPFGVVLLTFLPIALLLTITPGVGTALVVRSAATGGRRRALVTIAANEVGVLTWGLLSVLGISALVAASEVAFATLKVVGAVALLWLGVQTIARARRGEDTASPGPADDRGHRFAFRDGLLTSLTNPKLAVFFVALFPQFVPAGAPVLPATLLMATTIVVFDLAWYSSLALVVARARRAYDRSRLARRIEALTGAVLVGLGIRVALEPR
jgi:threonine/homoserine/homoserine lactone efflux protein